METMQERLRQHKRRRRLRILGRLITIVLVGYGLQYGWNYIHQPGLAIGSITIHGSSLLTEQEAIELGGSAPPFKKMVNNIYTLPLKRNLLTLISWGTIRSLRCPICSQKDLRFRNLASIVPTTHKLKFLFVPRYKYY